MKDLNLTWEKLFLDLQHLSVESPNSILPILCQVNSLLVPENDPHWILRKINFMSYELVSQSEDLNEQDRLLVLNDYFFERKNFQTSVISAYEALQEDLLLAPVLKNKSGYSLLVALLYLHLASELHLPIYLINFPTHQTLKWVGEDNTCYIDLSNNGKIMSETQMTHLLNKNVIPRDSLGTLYLDILPPKLILISYLELLSVYFKKHDLKSQWLTCLDLNLNLEPINTKCLGQRALLRKELGFSNEALEDLKTYFSYIDQKNSPLELQMAFRELMISNRFSTTTH